MIAVCRSESNEHLTFANGRQNTNLVGGLEGPAVDTVVGSVQVSLGEPGNVAVLEAATANGLEGSVPVKGLPCHLHKTSVSEGRLIGCIATDLCPPLVCCGAHGLGMGLLVRLEVGANEGNFGTVAEARGDRVFGNRVDRHDEALRISMSRREKENREDLEDERGDERLSVRD